MESEKPSTWTYVHGLVTLLLAVVATYQQCEQRRLEARLGSVQVAKSIIDRVDQYVERSGLSAERQAEVRVTMLAIAVEASEEESQETQRFVPFHFALLTNQPNILALLSDDPEIVKGWVGFALSANDLEVRTTAATALEQIVMLSEDQELVIQAAEDIMRLARRRPTDELIGALTAVAGDIKSRWTTSSDAFGPITRKLDGFLEQTTRRPESTGDIAAAPATHPRETSPGKGACRSWIEDLESDDALQRRQARSALASSRCAKELVPLLAKDEPYRRQLGALVALEEMPSGLDFPEKVIESSIQLLGHRDETIRTTSARFVVSLERPHDQRVAIDALLASLPSVETARDNPNQLFNTVVVLGELFDRTQESRIATSLHALRDSLTKTDYDWTNTIARIDQYVSRLPVELALGELFEGLGSEIRGIRLQTQDAHRDWLGEQAAEANMRDDEPLAGIEYQLGGSLLFGSRGIYANVMNVDSFCISYGELLEGEIKPLWFGRVQAGGASAELWSRGSSLTQDQLVTLLESIRDATADFAPIPACGQA